MPEREAAISQRVQDFFVLLCITDKNFLGTCRRTVKPQYFDSQVVEDIVKICYRYFDQFEKEPGDHFHDELQRFLSQKSELDVDLYISYLQRIMELDVPETSYILSRINSFVQAREFEEGAIKFAKLSGQGEFEEARQLMQSVLRAGIPSENLGIDYLSSDVPSYYGEDEDRNLIPTGFPIIDEIYKRGYCRGDLVCILGSGKGCKTWGLVHCVRESLLRGLKVLHISHEVSDKDMEKRYDMAFGAMTSEREPIEVEIEDIDVEGNLLSSEREFVNTVYDLEAVRKNRAAVRKFGGRLIIKKYPMGSCTMGEIERYMDYLEVFEGFIPDVVVNDYVEIMKLPNMADKKDSINQVYIESKRIADERRILFITVSQVNREGLRQKFAHHQHIGSDIQKLFNVDFLISLSQTDRMARMKRMIAYVMANRNGRQDIGCMFNYNLDIGQPVLQCWPLRDRGRDESQEREDG